MLKFESTLQQKFPKIKEIYETSQTIMLNFAGEPLIVLLQSACLPKKHAIIPSTTDTPQQLPILRNTSTKTVDALAA
jgi:hypothetical protein